MDDPVVDDEDSDDDGIDEHWRIEAAVADACERLRSNDPDRLVLNDDGLREINLYFHYLREVDTRRLTDALRANSCVQSLHLEKTVTRDDELQGGRSFIVPILESVLPSHPSLQTVNLSSNRLTDSHAATVSKAMKQNKTLTVIALGNNQIGDEGARALAEGLTHSNVECLHLLENPIGLVGVKALACALTNNSCLLKELNLTWCSLGAEGSKVIAAALKSKTCSLQMLNIYGCNSGDEGAKAVADGLRKNKSLMRLDIGGNRIGDEGVEAIAAALRSNGSLCNLNLSYNCPTNISVVALAFCLQDINYAMETISIYIPGGSMTTEVQGRLMEVCEINRIVNRNYRHVRDELIGSRHAPGTVQRPLALFSLGLALISSKSDRIFQVLRAKPDLCQQCTNRRRRTRP